jgi:hypothetical protein
MDIESVIFVVLVSLIIISISSVYINVYIASLYHQVLPYPPRTAPSSSSTSPSMPSYSSSSLSAISKRFSRHQDTRIPSMYILLTKNSNYTLEEFAVFR